jgi:hypothetical protein
MLEKCKFHQKATGYIQPLNRYFFDNGTFLNKKFMIAAWALPSFVETTFFDTKSTDS